MKLLSIIIFIILTLGADLKVTIFPYIHWVIWLMLLFPFMIVDFFKKGFVLSPMFGIVSFLIILGMISSNFYEYRIENVTQLMKIALTLLTLYYFLYYLKIGWTVANVSINSILLINCILLILGMVGFSDFSSLMTGDGRWGTFFAYPGSLVKIGAWGFYFNTLAFLLMKQKIQKLVYAILSIISLFVVYMDGSRTGMLIIFLTISIIIVFYFLVNYRNKVKAYMMPLVILIFSFVAVMLSLPKLLQSRIVNNMIDLLNSTSLTSGLAKIDLARFVMLKNAIDKISENPILGTGAFTTVSVHPSGTTMVVHNTYLQFWGDFGLFGMIGLLLLCFAWLAFLPKIWSKLQINNNIKDNILVGSSILMLFYFIISGLFHPYSTELSEWLIFIVPMTYCYNYYKATTKRDDSV